MANQYHDELGRFCSRNEMGDAVERLFTLTTSAPTEGERAAASEQWFTLKNEYDSIMAKPESTEEKLQNFLTGQADRDETYPATRAGMLKLLVSDEYKGEVKLEDINRLIDEIDGGSFLANYYTSVFESDKLPFSDKLRLARRYPDGIAVLANSNGQLEHFLKDPALEGELLESLGKMKAGDYTAQEAWKALAAKSNRPETKAVLIKEAANEQYAGTELPSIALAFNSSLTQQEALDLLENIAAHNPRDWGNTVKALDYGYERREDPENAPLELGDISSLAVKDDAKPLNPGERHQKWRRNSFALEDDRLVVNYLRAKAQLEMKKSQWERPTETLVLSFEEGRELKAKEARVDANELPELEKQVKQANKVRMSRKLRYPNKERAIDEYFSLRDRATEARRYRAMNERVSLLREELVRRDEEAAFKKAQSEAEALEQAQDAAEAKV